MLTLLALAVWLHLGTLLLTALFGYLLLRCFLIRGNRPLAVVIYCAVVAVLLVGLIGFSALAYHALPKIADTSIPAMVNFAEEHEIELPFTDFDSLKETVIEQAQKGATAIGQYAKVASYQFVMLAFGLVAPISLLLSPIRPPADGARDRYTSVMLALADRFRLLYASFAKVMGAQILISIINTALTTLFLLCNGYPYTGLLLMLVFLCGLLPVVGNLISNTVIVGVGFSLSPHAGLYALIFLILIHKLEYFLNSKIVGRRIGNPMWLTLIALLVGERLLGIAGMALAPVLLHYIKVETSAWRIDVSPANEAAQKNEASVAESSRPVA